MKNIIFCDIDGTLVDGFNGVYDVSLKNCEAIELLKKSAYFILTSGRAKFMLNDSILNLKPDGFILSNGAYIEFDGKVIKNDYFKNDQIQLIENFNDKYDGKHLLFNQSGYYSPYSDDKTVKDLLFNLGIENKFNLKSRENDFQFIVETFDDECAAERFVETFGKQFKIKRQYKSISYDINQLYDDKGKAVTFMIDYLSINKDNTYCIGDSENDIEMMNSVKHPIAMGNAKDGIKDIAEYVTDTIENDGVAKAIKHFKLI